VPFAATAHGAVTATATREPPIFEFGDSSLRDRSTPASMRRNPRVPWPCALRGVPSPHSRRLGVSIDRMPFSVGVSDHVMIAHSFADPYFGPAQRLHGATYTVEVEIATEQLNPHHVVMDIGALRKILHGVLQQIDYSNLDDHPAFPERTSTTERVAEHLANQIAQHVFILPEDARPTTPATLCVLLRESPVAYASFTRDL
jgi:6-pyruvoyltetrahydropterin/6-carboxytetrahydropterin synthase